MPTEPRVAHLRQQLLWPLRVMPVRETLSGHAKLWEVLQALGDASPWREFVDEYTGSPDHFHERHYNEFVTFLPYVQQFLFGEGRRERGTQADTPMRVFRRHDVKAVRLVPREGDAPLLLRVVHADLYFFYDVDVVILNLELAADDLSMAQVQDLMYRFGRGYPSGWQADGQPLHTMAHAEWLGEQGQVLAASDSAQREAFMAHVSEHRSPRIAAHWDFMLQPLVPDHTTREGALRYRQIEYYRMPQMAYLAVHRPQDLPRSDFVRLGLVSGAGEGLPFNEEYLTDFERRYCYDRFWCAEGASPFTRYLCNGQALIVVGSADSDFFRCDQRGVLAQFRHQHFLLFLVAHFQKAALLMFSDRLVAALKRMDVSDAESVKRFKRAIRAAFEGFLRFTHRYWFHEISEQSQVRRLFALCVQHLELDPLYREVKERIGDMSDYLDADSLRRQANTVVRLTVVTILGLIGTLTTGFLGMNLLAEADAPMPRRVALFVLVFVATTALTFYTVGKSKRLSDVLDALSDERLSPWQRAKALWWLWRKPQ